MSRLAMAMLLLLLSVGVARAEELAAFRPMPEFNEIARSNNSLVVGDMQVDGEGYVYLLLSPGLGWLNRYTPDFDLEYSVSNAPREGLYCSAHRFLYLSANPNLLWQVQKETGKVTRRWQRPPDSWVTGIDDAGHVYLRDDGKPDPAGGGEALIRVREFDPGIGEFVHETLLDFPASSRVYVDPRSGNWVVMDLTKRQLAVVGPGGEPLARFAFPDGDPQAPVPLQGFPMRRPGIPSRSVAMDRDGRLYFNGPTGLWWRDPPLMDTDWKPFADTPFLGKTNSIFGIALAPDGTVLANTIDVESARAAAAAIPVIRRFPRPE